MQGSTAAVTFLKLEIHLRQRQAEARCSSLSLTSVHSATIQATCLRGCCDPSHVLSVDQSEASPRNFSPHAQYGCNMPRSDGQISTVLNYWCINSQDHPTIQLLNSLLKNYRYYQSYRQFLKKVFILVKANITKQVGPIEMLPATHDIIVVKMLYTCMYRHFWVEHWQKYSSRQKML